MILFVFQSSGNPPKVYTDHAKAYDRARTFIDDGNKKAQALNPTGKAPEEYFGAYELDNFQTLSSYDLGRLMERTGETFVKLYTVKRSEKILGTETEVGSVWATPCKFPGESIEEAF